MLQFLKKLFSSKKEEIDIESRIFDCRRIDFISRIFEYKNDPHWYTYQFFIVFSSGLSVGFIQEVSDKEALFHCPELIGIRELFINNLGFSYLKLDLPSEDVSSTRKRVRVKIEFK